MDLDLECSQQTPNMGVVSTSAAFTWSVAIFLQNIEELSCSLLYEVIEKVKAVSHLIQALETFIVSGSHRSSKQIMLSTEINGHGLSWKWSE